MPTSFDSGSYSLDTSGKFDNPSVVPAGLYGIIDFVGYPVGEGVGRGHGGSKGAGKRNYYIRALIERMLEEETFRIMKRKLSDDAVTESTMRLKQKAFEKEVKEIAARRSRIVAAVSVILAEC